MVEEEIKEIVGQREAEKGEKKEAPKQAKPTLREYKPIPSRRRNHGHLPKCGDKYSIT